MTTAVALRGYPEGARVFAAVAAVVFGACLIGVLTRPTGLLASFWPANAILLGLMVSDRRRASVWGWLGAAVGYCAADLVTGASPLSTLLLNATNLVGVATGYLLFRRFDSEETRLVRPRSILIMVAIAIVASCAAGVAGMVPNKVLFDHDALSGFLFWSVTELVNYITVLPVMLTAPALSWRALRDRVAHPDLKGLLPAGGLFASMILGWLIGGPGAIGFSVTALLWCALSYNLFATACLTLAVSVWTLVGYSLGYLGVVPGADGTAALMSLRLGVALVCLGPLVVGSVMAARDVLMTKLSDAATRDFLTGALNRNGFTASAETMLGELRRTQQSTAFLLLDIDRFKAINDRYGHAAGDRVLVAFADTVRSVLRANDLFGRVGGEEFAILLPACDRDGADRVAQDIRAWFAARAIDVADATSITATVSIGVVVVPRSVEGLDNLSRAADGALYRAKELGRNRVAWHDDAPGPQQAQSVRPQAVTRVSQ
jgi:diguanylate cyclase (GGDEF)-like protein